jgi:hypothetical protein
MNLARPFKAGIRLFARHRRVATFEFKVFSRRYATRTATNFIPALKRRAKLIPTLRVAEHLIRASFKVQISSEQFDVTDGSVNSVNNLVLHSTTPKDSSD